MDNDEARVKGIKRLEQSIRDAPELSQRVTLIYRNPPPAEFGKDYNKFLCAHVKAARQQKRKVVR